MALTSSMDHPSGSIGFDASPAELSSTSQQAVADSYGSAVARSVADAISRTVRRLRRLLVWTFSRTRVTLCVEDEYATAVVLRGRRVVAWASADLDVSAAGEEGADDAARPARLRTLLEELGVARHRVITDLPSYASLTRNLLLPGVSKKYRGHVILAEVLKTVPFSEGEVDVSWSLQRAHPGHRVTAMAVPSRIVDRHVALLRASGVRPVAAFPRCSSIGLAAGLVDGVIVHLGARTDVITIRDGVAQVVYRLVPAAEGSDPLEEAESVVRAVERAAVYAGAHGEGQAPVLLAGPNSGETPLAQALRDLLGASIRAFQPPLSCPEHFPVAEFAANLGVATAHLHRRRAAGRCQDLLPERHRHRIVPMGPAGAVAGLLLLAAVAFNLTLQVGETSHEVDTLSERADTLDVRDRQRRLEASGAQVLEERTQQAERTTDAVLSYREDLGGQMEFLSRSLAILAGQAPPLDILLSGITPAGEDFQVSGVSPSLEGVLQYIENLRASPYFTDAQVTSAQAPGGSADGAGRVNFRITVSRAHYRHAEAEDDGPSSS